MDTLPENGHLVHIDTAAFFPVASMAVAGILMASVFIAVNIRYRDYKLLKMTSPNLNLVMLSGAILTSITVVMFGSAAWLPRIPAQEAVDTVSKINHAGLWLASISFTLFFAPLAAKTWRVHRIFSDAAVKGRVIKDDKLLCFVALMVIFDIGYLALWFGIDAPKCKVVPRSELPGFVSPAIFPEETDNEKADSTPTKSMEYQTCCISKLTPLWMVIMCVYKGAILYYIIYVAWATRYVTFPSMKDAGGLIISVFVALSSFCIGAPLVASLQRWPNVQYIVLSLAIFIPLFTVMMLHFLPKLILIRRHSKDEILTRSFSQYTTPKQPEYSDDEIRDLAVQNASLRKEVAEKQRRYKSVLEQLRMTKAKLFQLTMLTSESGDLTTCASDDMMRSVLTESTGDISTSDVKGKRKESLAQKVTRALILKSQGLLKPDEVSVSSSTTSQQVEEEKSEKTSSKNTDPPGYSANKPNEESVKQKDPDVSISNERRASDVQRSPRHVSFHRITSSHATNETAEPIRPALPSHGKMQTSLAPVVPKPMVPVMGRKSWDYYTRGTGYLRYKATVLKQGNEGTLAAITGYPIVQPRKHLAGDNTKQTQPNPIHPTAKLNEIPTKGVEMNMLSENPRKTKGVDFKYFSTSASSRSPSSSTDMTSSLGRSNDDTVSNNNIKQAENQKIPTAKPLEAQTSNNTSNDTDAPSTASAFSVVSTKGRRPSSSYNDARYTTKIGLQRIDDIGITYEDDYSSGSDSDEYDNTTTSMDSITCELFPPLTPRHKHYLRRYDAMQARYLASKFQKTYNKKLQPSEKSEGYSSGNDALNDSLTKSVGGTTESTTTSGKMIQNPHPQSLLNRDKKRKFLAQASRKLGDAYLYDSLTSSSDTDSESDWGNSAALKQCWERAAQAAQLPLLKPGPITYSHTRKDGIFV